MAQVTTGSSTIVTGGNPPSFLITIMVVIGMVMPTLTPTGFRTSKRRGLETLWRIGGDSQRCRTSRRLERTLSMQ